MDFRFREGFGGLGIRVSEGLGDMRVYQDLWAFSAILSRFVT